MNPLAPQSRDWTPYCGAGPAPHELLSRWNMDPVLLVMLALAACAWAAWRPGAAAGKWLVAAAWVALVVAFVSPLCALSSALFSARVAHHGLIVSVAAPLLVFGLGSRAAPRLPLTGATALHGMLFWFWHAPGAYAWALSSHAGYWLMQASLLCSALAFWSAVRQSSAIAAAAGLLVAMVQMGLLGALITFAGEPLYAPHLGSTQAWGLSPLADQQLAGLIMWAPLAGAYLLAALLLVGRDISRTSSASAA